MTDNNSHGFFHFQRPRINELFTEAAKYPLVVVCAGAGYGKTSAVHDFTEEYKAATLWIQLSERDNIGARFWENFSHNIRKENSSFAKAIGKIGFTDNRDKFNQFVSMLNNRSIVELKRRIVVLDDFHFIEEPSMIIFMESVITHLPVGTSLILVTRSTPPINIAGLTTRGQIFNINETDLRFTENELSQYFRSLDISLSPESQSDIMHDTEGWALAINIIARSYQKAPGYEGYLRSAMKTNIFRLMETEIWEQITKPLQIFLIRLSLIDHLSVDLISLLAKGNGNLITNLEKINAYVRRDGYINAYLIHPLFLEFLSTKQKLLTEKQKQETYAAAGNWCVRNAFKIDALSYYEKIGDYRSIVSIFSELPVQIPENIAKFSASIFDRAPEKVFNTVEFLAIMHLRSYICQGLWKKSTELAEYYENKFLNLPENNPFRNLSLSGIYYFRAYLRGLECLCSDRYDFDRLFGKFIQFLPKASDAKRLPGHSPGTWIVTVGSSRKNAPAEYIDALSRTYIHLSKYSDSSVTGEEELARGELAFYQGNLDTAEKYFSMALKTARDKKHYEIEQMVLFYTMRLRFVQGDFEKAALAVKDLKNRFDNSDYTNRFTRYDVSLSWYYFILGLRDKIPDWLKENFAPYSHAAFIENFANQMKARYFYMTRKYSPILTYIGEMKQRESFLFGRLEMLVMEACIHYKMKNKKKAFAILAEAYKTASPNDLVMPFIEFGKDIRTLCAVAQKEADSPIPSAWLKTIHRKASTYAKYQAHAVTEYKLTFRLPDSIALSARETEILTDLSYGLSRAEIAASRDLSINTVKMLIKNIYYKTGAKNLADLIRMAVTQKLI